MACTLGQVRRKQGKQQWWRCEHSSLAQLSPLCLFAPVLTDTHSPQARTGPEPWGVAFSRLLAVSLLFVKTGLLGKGAPALCLQPWVPSPAVQNTKIKLLEATDWALPSSQSPEERKAASVCWASGVRVRVCVHFPPLRLLCSTPFLMLPAFILFFLFPSFGSMFGLLFCFILA